MIPMYNPITNTIGTTDRPQKQPKTTKTTINRRFKNFVKFNTHWNFKRVHAQHCQGHFAPAPHWKEESKGSRTPTAKEVCTVCGAVSFQRFYNLGEISTIGYRLQKSRQHSKDYEIVFEGYLPKKLLRVDNPDQDHKKPTFENICLSCELGFNGKSINGLCPSCANNERSDVTTIKYDTHASSHAGYIELWQQGQYDEVQSDKNPQYHKKLKIQQWKYNSIMAQMHKSDTWDEEQTLLRKLNNIMEYNDKIHSAELTKKQKAIKARPTLFNPRDYERRVKNADKNAFELTRNTKPIINPDLRECALSDVKNVPTNAEVIEVTRAKNHILSPSWPVLKAYKHNGDWIQYTAAFMAEMAQPGPIAEMKRIINKAKDHPVYLACFEKVGHCHRFLLLDWMNRLSATC